MCSFLEICSNRLRASLQNLERTSTSLIGRRSHGKPERTDDFDCTVCLKLLYKPITTSCGHSFCRSCLFQSMDRGEHLAVVDKIFHNTFISHYFLLTTVLKILGNKCPLCRTVLFISPRTCAVRWVAYVEMIIEMFMLMVWL